MMHKKKREGKGGRGSFDASVHLIFGNFQWLNCYVLKSIFVAINHACTLTTKTSIHPDFSGVEQVNTAPHLR